jgi:hypothetical protein
MSRASKWQMYSFMSTKKLTHFDPRSIEEYTGCIPQMLSIPYSVKLLSSLLWTGAFRNTRNWSKPWSTRKGHSFLLRFSGVQKSIPFPYGTEHTQFVRLKAVPQSELKACTYILKISEFQIEQEKSHTHTKCWYTVRYLVSKFPNSIYWISRFSIQEVIEPQDTLVPSINSHNPYEVFFQGFLCIPKQWIYSMSVK